MQRIILFLLSFISVQAIGQTMQGPISIYFSPLTFLDFHSYARMGIAKDFTPKHTVLVEVGYGKNFTKKQYTRSQLRLDYRHNIDPKEDKSNAYYYVGLFFNARKLPKTNFSYTDEDNITPGLGGQLDSAYKVSFVSVDQQINKIGGNIGFGGLFKISSHFYLDLNLGIGLASRNVAYNDAVGRVEWLAPYLPPKEQYIGNRFSYPKTLPAFSMKTGLSLVYKIF